jgi:hypothetical protein
MMGEIRLKNVDVDGSDDLEEVRIVVYGFESHGVAKLIRWWRWYRLFRFGSKSQNYTRMFFTSPD